MDSPSLEQEFARWSQIQTFLQNARGRLQGRLLAELNNVLCRFLLGWFNHPLQRNEVIKKAREELSEQKISRTIPYHILEEVPRPKTKPDIRSTIDHSTVTIHVNNHDFTFPKSKYEKLLTFTSLENITKMILWYDGMLCRTGQFWGLMPATWQLLKDKYDVEFEGFACPLNFTLPKFFSLFPDVDAVFGSQGNFLTSELKPGNYAVNPPYVESIMFSASKKVLELLERDEPSTCFFLLPNWIDIPGWEDAPSILMLTKSNYLKGRVVLGKRDHSIYDYMNEKPILAYFSNLFLVLSNTQINGLDMEEIRRSFV